MNKSHPPPPSLSPVLITVNSIVIITSTKIDSFRYNLPVGQYKVIYLPGWPTSFLHPTFYACAEHINKRKGAAAAETISLNKSRTEGHSVNNVNNTLVSEYYKELIRLAFNELHY